MSARYTPVGWNRTKLVYDAILIAAVLLFTQLYPVLQPLLSPRKAALDDQTIMIQTYGLCAFLLVSIILAIGPLARLDPRALPLLYNRRHFGVITCAVAALHAMAVLDWYFAYSDIPPLEALLSADTSFGQLHGFPFIPLGIAAFLIFCLLASTSHDFWLAFLTPRVWKALHMSLYAAYALIVAHVAFGAMQSALSPALGLIVTASAATLTALHLAAGRRDPAPPPSPEPPWLDAPWLDVAGITDIPDTHALVVHVPNAEPVAIFRDGLALSAVTNLCAHQNGPLGEGRVIDGCITCPWHGFQYRLADGCAPPPYTEKLATYRLRRVADRIWLDPRPNPPGTFVEPLVILP